MRKHGLNTWLFHCFFANALLFHCCLFIFFSFWLELEHALIFSENLLFIPVRFSTNENLKSTVCVNANGISLWILSGCWLLVFSLIFFLVFCFNVAIFIYFYSEKHISLRLVSLHLHPTKVYIVLHDLNMMELLAGKLWAR